jgi:hypothetical protein
VKSSALAAAFCVLVLSACGGQGNAPAGNGEQPSAAAPVVSGSPPTNTPATGAQPETTPPPVACLGSGLSVTKSTDSGAAGTIVARFIITNTGTLACTMEGNPIIAVRGTNVDVKPIPSTFGPIGAPGGKQTLAVGYTAVFFLKWSQISADGSSCRQAAGFAFRPPGDASTTDNVSVDLQFSPCGGEVEVSDIFAPSVGS